MYQATKAAKSAFVPIRNLQYHVLTWGTPRAGQPPLVMVHGWMDVAASWQFVVDAFATDRWVIAPDWRGFGLTQVPPTDSYWFPDYLADLDFLLDHYAPDTPVDLVGHSMGGNVSMMYAGARPQRIRRLVNLEGFGMPVTQPSQAPGRYATWMDELKAYHRGEMALAAYESADGVARRLMKTNRRLSQDKADWLALRWARQVADGTWRILGEAAHKVVSAHLSRVDELLELYKSVEAPTLVIEATDAEGFARWMQGKYTLDEYHERLKNVRDCRIEHVADAGHMLHHDQPERVAALIEDFLG